MMEYKVVVSEDATLWYKPGTDERHREDGPAIEFADGTKEWYLHGNLHREDGPAVEYADGYKAWLLNDKLHREDGPAVENASGTKCWYLHGEKLSEAEFDQRMNTCDGKTVEVDGKTYRLTLVK